MKIGLFYGSTTCYTEMTAEKIQQHFGVNNLVLHNIKDTPLTKTAEYDCLILGISTWDYGELQEDWESHWSEIEQLDLSDKIIALYGMGDQIGYTDWFQDALGMLHEVISVQQPLIIGYWPNEGYDFAQSKALTPDKSQFVGLSLDEDNQYQLTDERIKTWCEQLNGEIEQIFSE